MSEEEKCFKRICKEAEANLQVIPSSFFLVGDEMWCEREDLNPSIYAERINGIWVQFFEEAD